MGNTNKYCLIPLLLPFLIVYLYLSKVSYGLEQISHPIEPNRPVSFLVVGDWGRKGAYNQSAVARAMGVVGSKLGIDFVVSTGDNFYELGLNDTDDPAFTQSFSNIYTAASLQKPWYAVLGNHDYYENPEAELDPVLRVRDRRWNCHRSYIVRAGFLDIFFVDTSPFVEHYFYDFSPERIRWHGLPRNLSLAILLKGLERSIKSSNAVWKIVVGHHTMRSIGAQGDTVELLHKLLPILQENKIPMYINGHDHCLQHISNIGPPMEFLTSGGGSKAWRKQIRHGSYKKQQKFYYDGQGFMSVQLTRSVARVAFYNIHGRTMHSFKINKACRKGFGCFGGI